MPRIVPKARAMPVLDPCLDRLAARVPGVLPPKYVFSQCCSRKDNFLCQVLRRGFT